MLWIKCQDSFMDTYDTHPGGCTIMSVSHWHFSKSQVLKVLIIRICCLPCSAEENSCIHLVRVKHLQHFPVTESSIFILHEIKTQTVGEWSKSKHLLEVEHYFCPLGSYSKHIGTKMKEFLFYPSCLEFQRVSSLKLVYSQEVLFSCFWFFFLLRYNWYTTFCPVLSWLLEC